MPGEPEYGLIDWETFPEASAEPVVRKGRRPEGRNQRAFILIVVVGFILTAAIAAGSLGAAFLEPEQWRRPAPEVKEVRMWAFFTAGPIIGYFFAFHQDHRR
ncbi:hypothetical protein [Actinocorallia herbida]|uniref:hypothetical protein n=1 Tax=Actinocorallia herbida TaxID=58109 RepID=UPI000F4CA0F4|nr:hypothetical protein [Actinocorallia herbida]